ncbi:cation:proton antiporter [Marilutibacter alkalisoli]|uniref:Sodium:proton antiporter n=1 Tax=Marilutibacter alkalisoli TaxID=2591633 RepID=A0A514BSJ2_9GAMM|nr:cation:proton antiporter [Lysobacter alkalisoli]QDH70337.1 sodium:proton antiporter [Lysobacter alkalisoli]
MDAYALAILIVGLALLGAAWVPHLVKRNPLTFPIIYVAAGALLYALPLPLPPADPVRYPLITEHLTELAVIVALVGVGLRIDTRFGWRRWALTWRLLGITMPLTILAGLWLGQAWLGYSVATAMLLGAVLAPTDPVLAGDVQVHAPGKGGEDPVRFALTSEAGLNDGLAFPFVWLAVVMALASAGEPMDWGRWLALDVLWRVLGGVAIGVLVGYALMHLIFRSESEPTLSKSGEGLAALAITLTVYGVAELCHTYGFLAVFVAALMVRQKERDHDYHGILDTFAQQCEKLLMAVMLLLLGGALASGILSDLDWRGIVFALVFVLLVRPLAGWLGLIGASLTTRDRWAIAVFGVRGIGSLYYLAFAVNHAEFRDAGELWAVVCLVVVLSILIHGLTASGAMAWLDRRRRGRTKATKGDLTDENHP